MSKLECFVPEGTLDNMPVFDSGKNIIAKDITSETGGIESFSEEDEAIIQDSLDWRKHLTPKAIIVGTFVGFLGGIIYLQIMLLSPISPSLNVVYSLFSYMIIKTLVGIVTKCGCFNMTFTKQENVIAQTLAMTASAGSQNLGYSTWFAAMMPVYGEEDGLTAATVNTNSFGLLIGTSVSVLFPGIFLMTFMTKYFATNDKLPFPSGTAAGITLQSFHNGCKETQELVQKQLTAFGKFFTGSFLFTLVTTVFGYKTSACANAIPFFGTPFANKWFGFGNWDYNLIFVGVGMMLTTDFVWSICVGMFLNCFWFQPWIAEHGVDIMYPSFNETWGANESIPEWAWYSTSKFMHDGKATPPIRMAYGYKVFMFALVLIGEGLYVIGKCAADGYKAFKGTKVTAAPSEDSSKTPVSVEEKRRAYRKMAIMDRGQPMDKKFALGAFLCLGAMAVVIMTSMYDVIWWLVLISFFFIAPFIAIPNVYFIGLQDQDVSAILGKIPMFLLPMAAAAYYGDPEKGIIPGLVAQAAVMGICGQTGLLMQDFRTAYITETSPKAMFMGQIIGACVAMFAGPATWLIFNKAFPVLGVSGKFADLANAPAYRAIATVGAYGVSILPEHCLKMCLIGTGIAFCMAAARDHIPHRLGKHGWIFNYIVISPTAIALAVYMGTANGNSDYPWGGLIAVIWKFFDKGDFKDYYPIVAAALISGASICTLIAGILQIFGVDTSIYCLSFE